MIMYFYHNYQLPITYSNSILKFSLCCIIDLPKDARLHDLASLSAIDSKDINAEELGSDVIKAQQAANLKYLSDQCAVILEDRAQVMLARVSDS